jgi:hypothetical protein
MTLVLFGIVGAEFELEGAVGRDDVPEHWWRPFLEETGDELLA